VFQPQLSVDMGCAVNNKKNDDCVNVLRQKDETKNKKKITGTETETKIRKLFSDFSNSPGERTRGCCRYTILGFS